VSRALWRPVRAGLLLALAWWIAVTFVGARPRARQVDCRATLVVVDAAAYQRACGGGR
jgi:hypothetical protein